MKILLLSAYDAASHRRWREILVASFLEHDWTILTLPARYFSWRIRGNSLSWAFTKREVLTQRYDLIIATSMVDLSSLRGFTPSLSLRPTLVYFHENQFAYPDSGHQFSSVEPQVLNLYTALAADTIVFNSQYNYSTFLQGVDNLLRKMPDHTPNNLPGLVRARSSVIPVPLSTGCFITSKINTDRTRIDAPLTLVWNHRWEYDKAPERLFAAIKQVLALGIEIQLYIVGQQFRQQPPVFAQMHSYLCQHHPEVLKQWGFVADRQEYRDILVCADVVVSTALHDFQGLAVLDAVAAGCIPLVPNRLCYGEWFDQQYLYHSHIDEPEREVKALAQQIAHLTLLKRNNALPCVPDISSLCISTLKDDYRRIFAETINRHSQPLMESVL